MIVPMQKYSILVFHRDTDVFLSNLQSLGMVDVTRRKKELDTEGKDRMTLLTRYILAIRKLKELKVEREEADKRLKGEQLLLEFEQLQQSKTQTEQQLKNVDHELAEISVFGNCDTRDIERLRKLGFTPRFYSCAHSSYHEAWEQLQVVKILNKDSRNVYFVALQNANEPMVVQGQELKAPMATLAEKQMEHDMLESESERIGERIKEIAGQIAVLEKAKAELMDNIDYTNVKASADGQAEDKLMVFTGWIPQEQSPTLDSFLDSQDVLYLQEPIENTDKVPIKLKNNKFARLFEPIVEMFSLPNYHELDVTPFMAPFFMLFFGFCFCDAGYGILLITVGFILKPRVPEAFRDYVSLAQWLGLAAVLFGLLTGSAFGIEFVEVEAFKGIKHWFLKDTNSLMILSIALGAVQVLVGMVLKAVKIKRQKGLKYALVKFAWVFFLISMAAAFGLPYIGVVLPTVVLYGLYGIAGLSAVFIFFYNSPGKNPLLNVGLGMWESFEMATGLLGDLLSYVRLFALGLTGGLLGGAFNKMAIMLAPDIPVLGFIVSAIILIMGHTINIMLGMLGAIIHPIRLTFVEFFKNAGYEGGGEAYKPFKHNQPK